MLHLPLVPRVSQAIPLFGGGVAAPMTGQASASLHFTPSASVAGDKFRAATATLTFSATASAGRNGGGGGPIHHDHRGRVRLGFDLPVELVTHAGLLDGPAEPELPPTVRAYSLATGRLVGSGAIPRDDPAADPTHFRGGLTTGYGWPLGHCAAVYYYRTGSITRADICSYEITDGDANGPVVAAHRTVRPGREVVLAQLGSGRLARGRDPYLDEGIR